MAVSNKRLTEELALATRELSAMMEGLANPRKVRTASDSEDDWSSASEPLPSGIEVFEEEEVKEEPVVLSAISRVSGKLRVRREESRLLKTTGGVDEREKTIEKFRSSKIPVDIFRLRRECVSGNSVTELIADYKNMQKEALQQLDRDYVQNNVRQAGKVALPSEALRKLHKAAVAHEARILQAQEKHKEVEKEKAEIRLLSLSRDPVARQTVAAYRALPVSVISSSQAAASPLLNQDPARRWASVLVAATFAGKLGGAAESLVLKRKRDEAWKRFHLVARQVSWAIHWKQLTRRAKKAIKSWIFAIRCMRLLRKHWRRRREQRSAEIVKTLVMNALNAGKARFAIRRFLHSTRKIQTAWKQYLEMQEQVLRRWNKVFLEAEYKYLISVFKEHREGRAIETKDSELQEMIIKTHADRAARVLSVEDDSEPSTPRLPSLHPGLAGRRRALIRVDSGPYGAFSMQEWAAAQSHRLIEPCRLKEATRFAILASEFHNRMRARSDARRALLCGFGNYAMRVKELYEFLGFFGIQPEKADRTSLAPIKAQYEQIVSDLRKSGALSSIKEFADIMTVVTNAHRDYGTSLVIEKANRKLIEISSEHS